MKAPGKVDCEKFLKESNILKDDGRDWKVVKYFVHNRITLIKRNVGQQYRALYPWELAMWSINVECPNTESLWCTLNKLCLDFVQNSVVMFLVHCVCVFY